MRVTQSRLPENHCHLPHSNRVLRRDLLRIGCLSAFGMGLDDWFRLRSLAAEPSLIRAKSCILIWLDGGPSHLETFDLKPAAPAEVRGPFRAIDTNVAGIQIGELLPQTAKITDQLAIVRSMTSPLGEHGLANQYLLSGYKPSPVLQYPGYGSVVTHLRGGQQALPPYVAIPESRSTGGAGFLGPAFEPFSTGGDPAHPSFQVRDLNSFPQVTEARINRRRKFLAEFDAIQTQTESFAESSESQANTAFDQAFRLVTSQQAKQAFDLNAEPQATRAQYGPRMLGQSCLLARRLVEQGVPFVSILNTGWDTHEGLVLHLRDGYSGAKVGVGLIPTFDQAFSALIEDLKTRGLLDETLVIAMGEFGRTPKLNPRGGRDHWPRAFSVVLAGAGINGGQVIGSSDRVGESPLDNPVTPSDLARTIYTLLGIDPDHELKTADGRPVPVNQGGRTIPELVHG